MWRIGDVAATLLRMLQDLPDLTGRVAIVTGASRGIGRAVAVRLAEAGADVAVAARTVTSEERTPGSIRETAEAITGLGRRALAVRTNVRKEDDLRDLVEQTAAGLGRIDIVVNNAGALWWDTMESTPTKRFDLVMDVNARAAFILSREALPHLRAAGGGHILVFSPAIDPGMSPGRVGYCISKFGMTLIAHGLAQEVRADGIAVTALWPATLVESQATIHHGIGTPAMWRKPAVVADATLAIVSRPCGEVSGRAMLDEEALAEVGVTDLSGYACVPGAEPVRIVGDAARSPLWSHRPPAAR